MKFTYEIDLNAAWKTDGDGDVEDWCSSIGNIIRSEIEKYVRKEVLRVITEGRILAPIIEKLRDRAVEKLLAFEEDTGVEMARKRVK